MLSLVRHQLICSLFIYAIFCLSSCGPAPYQKPGNATSMNLPVTSQQSAENTTKTQPSPSGTTRNPSTSACLGCHESYRSNHHPYDIVPDHPSRIPFPLYGGMITCLTCHNEDVNASDHMLRARSHEEGPDICFRCHSPKQYADIDPHIMLENDGAVVKVNGSPVCLVCHSVKPNPEVDRTKDVKFKADVAFLCWRCHGIMANTMFFGAHFLTVPSGSMQNYIRKRERDLSVTIPLVPRQRITCSTCHNPHQRGVIVYPPSAKGADSKDRLRLPKQTLCLACHEF